MLLQLGGAAPSDARLLLGADAATLRAVLHEISALITSRGGGGRLVVYYSGHAGATGLHLGDSLLDYGELERAVRAVAVGARVIIVDGCRSGGLSRVKGGQRAKAFHITADGTADVEGTAIITSSAAGEDSHESDTLRAALFSHHLFNGLRGAADLDGDRTVNLDEVYRYTRRETLRASGSAERLQRPTFRYDLQGRAPLVMTRLAAASSSARRRLKRPGLYVLTDASDGRVVAEVPISRADGELVVPPGAYLVQRRERRAYIETEIDVGPGQTRTVGVAGRTIAYAQLVRKGGGGARGGPWPGPAGRGARRDRRGPGLQPPGDSGLGGGPGRVVRRRPGPLRRRIGRRGRQPDRHHPP